MQALAAAGERAEALRVRERCRVMLADELGVDPAPETEAIYLSILGEPAVQPVASVTARQLPSGVVTFLLTDIVNSTRLWETHPGEMAEALARHNEVMAEAVADHGGTLLKTRGEGDSTFSGVPMGYARGRRGGGSHEKHEEHTEQSKSPTCHGGPPCDASLTNSCRDCTSSARLRIVTSTG